jgi:hypothetical protein
MAVRLVSRPYFSAAPGALPALDVGPATVTFVQDGAGGALVLLGNETLMLPFVITLDAEGRSLEPIDLTLRYEPQRKEAILELDQHAFLQSVAPADGGVQVVLAAGPVADWTIENLVVTSKQQARKDESPRESAVDDMLPSLPAPEVVVNVLKESRERFAQGDFDGAEKLLQSINRQQPGTLGWELETVHHLIRAGFAFNSRGEAALASKIGQRAMKLLAKAGRETGHERSRMANLKELTAVIQERLLGDGAGAHASYAEAVDLSPESGQAAARLKFLNTQRSNEERGSKANDSKGGN